MALPARCTHCHGLLEPTEYGGLCDYCRMDAESVMGTCTVCGADPRTATECRDAEDEPPQSMDGVGMGVIARSLGIGG